jgi:hypothetical protein
MTKRKSRVKLPPRDIMGANNTLVFVARSWIGSIMHSKTTCFISMSDSQTKPNYAGESVRP